MVGDVNYAIDVQHVVQVVNPMGITPLPDTPPSIVGVTEHRGLVAPIVDLRLMFGMHPEATRKTKWILVEVGNRVTGVVVDAVTGVFTVSSERIQPAPELGPGDVRRPFSGMTSTEGRLVFVLDLAKLHEGFANIVDMQTSTRSEPISVKREGT
jgi:purine-binding chemotaxis protein CheW